MRTRNLLAKKSSVSRRRSSLDRPSWLWRWHHLISAFVIFFGVGMVLASFQYNTVKHNQAQASVSDNLVGWMWADPIGWISVNDVNAAACASAAATPSVPCGSYGLNVETNPASVNYLQLNGFAWNDSAGWMCFGTSCKAVSPGSCSSTPPTGNPNDMIASIGTRPASAATIGSPPQYTVDLHGWADICNLGNKGWVSLNSSDLAGAGASYAYRTTFVPSSGYFGIPLPTAGVKLDSYAWNGNTDGTGYGYIDFSNVKMAGEIGASCSDGLDNDLNGKADCQDDACKLQAVCAEDTNAKCSDGVDNNGNGLIDCADSSCKPLSVCQEKNGNVDHGGVSLCADGIDDDGNGLIDCADVPNCAGYPACSIVGEATCNGQPKDNLGRTASPDTCCSDHFDNDSNGKQDCTDTSCFSAPICLPVWLQAKYGDIYAQQGINSAAGQSSGSYCLSSNGTITGFTSGSSFANGATCSEPTSGSISLPNPSTGYKGTLGGLDIAGIKAGRYGKVIPVVPGFWSLPSRTLGGNVYYATGDVTINGATFQNGLDTTRGNGLLFVDGGNLTIKGNIGYAAESLPPSLHNLASFGVIVSKKAGDVTGLTGNVSIDPSVSQISGAYFVEGTVHTGSAGPIDAQPLQVFGLMAAHQFALERNFHSTSQASETFVFDGRAIANPPPGMQEVSKSLPTTQDAF